MSSPSSPTRKCRFKDALFLRWQARVGDAHEPFLRQRQPASTAARTHILYETGHWGERGKERKRGKKNPGRISCFDRRPFSLPIRQSNGKRKKREREAESHYISFLSPSSSHENNWACFSRLFGIVPEYICSHATKGGGKIISWTRVCWSLRMKRERGAIGQGQQARW